MEQGHPAGGSRALAELIDKHGSALAFDFQHLFGVSLVDVIADLCSGEPATDPRYWLALIGELPADSAFAASFQGGHEYRGWDMKTYLLASIFDAVQVNTVSNARVAGAKKVKDPPPWPRPGKKHKDPSGGTTMASIIKSGMWRKMAKSKE